MKLFFSSKKDISVQISCLRYRSNKYFCVEGALGRFFYNIQEFTDGTHHLADNFYRFIRELQLLFQGVVNGFYYELKTIGLGFRLVRRAQLMVLDFGYSHCVFIKIPEDVDVFIRKKRILVFGLNKNTLLQFLTQMLEVRPISNYKAKGLAFKDQEFFLKEGKKK